MILKQYLSSTKNFILTVFLTLGTIMLYFINNEYFSVSLYHKYKIKELEIRNNLKLGVPSINEFHIEKEVSIFFENQRNNKFFNVDAIIYENGQFIKAISAEIEINKKSYNLIFYNGERIILNDTEKSKTSFDKFIYSLENKAIEELMMDKEHYNTIQLLKLEDKEFNIHGHNRIYQYILIIGIVLLSSKIFFLNLSKKNIFKYYFLIFFGLLIVQVINSYLIFLLKFNGSFNLFYYYFINLLILLIFCILVWSFNENN